MEFPCLLFNDSVEPSETFVFESHLQPWQSNFTDDQISHLSNENIIAASERAEGYM